MKPKKQKSETDAKGLFDHVNHIRQKQNSDYFSTLTEADKKSFNKYMILRFLSMDQSIIEEIAYISKYMDVLDEEAMYKCLIAVVPISRNYFPYVKSKVEIKFSNQLIDLVCKKFECSTTEAEDYCNVLTKIDVDNLYLTDICRGFGLTDKEIKTTLKYEK